MAPNFMMNETRSRVDRARIARRSVHDRALIVVLGLPQSTSNEDCVVR